MQQTFHRRSLFVINTVQAATQDLSKSCLMIIDAVFARVSKSKTMTDRNLDVLAGLSLLLSNLNGPGTPLRHLSCDMALQVANQPKVFAPGELERFMGFKRKLDAVQTLHIAIARACDTSFLYWHRQLTSLYLEDLYENPTEAHRLQYLFAALNDCLPLVRQAEAVTTEPLKVRRALCRGDLVLRLSSCVCSFSLMHCRVL